MQIASGGAGLEVAQVNSVALHYRLSGPEKAPALVFSNSLGTDFRIWDEVEAALSDRYRILCYDKRGHGLSDGPEGGWGMQDSVHDLAALMDNLGLKSAAVCGLSVGGLIAQGLAAERPDLVKLLILSDTAAKIGSPDMWSKRIAAVRQDGIGAIAEDILQRWFAPDYIASSPDFPMYRNMLVRTPVHGYVTTCQAIADTDLIESTSALQLPALAIVGDKDGATPPDLVRETAQLIDGCRFELIRGAGHLPCVERPEAVVSLLSEFMTGNGHG